MKILFKESFAKDLERISDGEVVKHVRHVIESIQAARTLSDNR